MRGGGGAAGRRGGRGNSLGRFREAFERAGGMWFNDEPERGQPMTEPTFKAVLIDLGNVIAGFDHMRACAQLAEFSEDEVSAAEVYDFIFGADGWTGLNHAYETGDLGTKPFRQTVMSRFKLDCRRDSFEAAWADIFTIDAEVVLRLRERAERLPLYLCSNTNPLHWRHVLALEPGLQYLFRGLFLSFEMKVRKPEPGYFKRVLEEIRMAPGECLFIDDMDRNISAARAEGIQTLHYRGIEDLKTVL